MRKPLHTLVLALCLLPLASLAGPSNLPVAADAQWYVHANVLEMRQTVAGQQLYAWLDGEVFSEIEEELGIDLGKELDGVTVFGSGQGGHDAAVILHGFFSAQTREEVLARINTEATMTVESAYGRTYYRVSDPDALEDEERRAKHAEAHFEGAELAFGDMGQTLITQDAELMNEFLASGGHFAGSMPAGLLVIQAEHPLLQGGMDAQNLHLEGGPWESEMFQNVQQAALTIADDNGLVSIRAEVVAVDPMMADAISNIIQGVVSLQALANEDPEAAALLANLKVTTEGTVVNMALSLEPEKIVEILD
ncbi:MAG: hypothetical protein R3200_01855 [Xanthomonadales bacterium]|nr:hypothetical protein [Xanthomonadales bacterium]